MVKCKHENKRKLFWKEHTPPKWHKTDLALCIDCKDVIRITEEKEKVMEKDGREGV